MTTGRIMENQRIMLSPESANASDIFDKFFNANTLKGILAQYRQLCSLLRIKPTHFPEFYPRLKAKLCSWRVQGLWTKIEKRASSKCYARAKACSSNRVLIIGAGPCGLRTAIEAQLLGAKVVLIEKRDRFSRNNVLHLWPFVITDLKGLGAKKFYGKFCAGAIDHISIRQLQCMLLKVALLLGVEVHEGVAFEGLCEPTDQEGWRAFVSPPEHPVSQYNFDCLVGADGRRNTLDGFKRKALRAKLAIAITANFINKRTEAEARVKEISGVSYVFNQKFFQDLNEVTGIDLENIVYYKDETHYFVMTAKKQSLLAKGVLLNDYADTARLLSHENISTDNLITYAVEAAMFSTENQLPDLEFAVNHYGQPDVAMFDFTAMYAAENACRIIQRRGHKLMMTLVGDSLLEPFWPTGSGCARGFLSCFDASWMLRSWASGSKGILEVIAERESIYRLLGQTTPENLNKEHMGYTIDPYSRYPNLNLRLVTPFQVIHLFDTDENYPDVLDAGMEQPLVERQRPKRRRDSVLAVDSLLAWIRKQLTSYGVEVNDVFETFSRGDVLCALLHRFRPDLIEYPFLSEENVNPVAIAACRNQVAFDLFEGEYDIKPIMGGHSSIKPEAMDYLTLVSYLTQIYETFKGEIPQTRYGRGECGEESEDGSHRSSHASHQRHRMPSVLVKHVPKVVKRSRIGSGINREHRQGDVDISETSRRQRRRRNDEKSRTSLEEREKRRLEIEKNKEEREKRRLQERILQRERFIKSMRLLQLNVQRREEGSGETDPYEDYTFHLYRQTAPDWDERCKTLEKKLFYSGKGSKLTNGGIEVEKSCVPGLARSLEEKLKGTKFDKKPKDLIRSIGKIEKSDWNVQLIEKKIAENRTHGLGRKDRDDKVPKWSKEAFDDKREAMKRRMEGSETTNEKDDRVFEDTMKKVSSRLKEGNALELGQRGSNKVSQMADQLVDRLNKQLKEPEVPTPRPTYPLNLFEAKKGGSELCHFCKKNVYVVERVAADGTYFHRNCFRCEFCNTALRIGNYVFDKDGKYGDRFLCTPHFNYIRQFGWKRSNRKVDSPDDKESPVHKYSEYKPNIMEGFNEEVLAEMEDRGTTPERVEFENSMDVASEEEPLSEMDEDEWTDRNFGASNVDNNTSDEASEISEDEEELTPEGQNNKEMKHEAPGLEGGDDSDSDTEVASGEDSSGEEFDDDGDEDEEDECEGSTTEIETDSEFAEDPPQTVPGGVPTIIVQEPEPLVTRFFDVHSKPSLIPHTTGTTKKEPTMVPVEEVYEELRLVDPVPKVRAEERRALPKVYAIPKRWEPLAESTRIYDPVITSKGLELKQQYLHGGKGPITNANPKKPITQSTHNQFTSVLDMISEQQKRLQPAPNPSPAMQAFLQGTDKLKTTRFQSTEAAGNQATSPRCNRFTWNSDKGNELINENKTDTMNKINIEKTLEAESTKLGKVSPNDREKCDIEKDIPVIVGKSEDELMKQSTDSYEKSLDPVFTQSESTTESQTTTIIPAKMDIEEDIGGLTDSCDELSTSGLDDEGFPELSVDNVCKEPPRVEIEDEFGVTLALDVEDEKKAKEAHKINEAREKNFGISSSDSKDSLNSALFLETEISDWTEDGKFIRRRRVGKNKQAALPCTDGITDRKALHLDLDNLDFMDVDGLSSPDDFIATTSRRKGYSRLLDEEINPFTPEPDEGSTSSLNGVSSSPSTTPTLGSANICKENEIQTELIEDKKVSAEDFGLFDRVVPFSKARDSLDYRKRKGVTSPVKTKNLFTMFFPPEDAPQQLISPEEEEKDPLPIDGLLNKTLTSPKTARKLNELTKERAKDNELIRSMVMGRIRKSPEKNRRGSRGSLVQLTPESSSSPSSSVSVSLEVSMGRADETRPLVSATSKSMGEGSLLITTPFRMVESVTNPPTPVNPASPVLTPLSPDSKRWDVISRKISPAFYGSLPNISSELGKMGVGTESKVKVVKIGSFLTPCPKTWENYKHVFLVDREKARKAARDRARLMSDEELGLSPPDRIEGLKVKLRRKTSVPEDDVFLSQIGTYPLSLPSPEPTQSIDDKLLRNGGDVSVAASIRHNVDFPMKRHLHSNTEEQLPVRRPHYKRAFSADFPMEQQRSGLN